MSQTVIGFFDDASEAQRAVEQLQARGISNDRIDLSRGRGATGSTDYDTLSTSSNSDGLTNSSGTLAEEGADAVDRTAHRTGNAISNFFRSLFGDDDDDNTTRYSRVAADSGAIVTVHAQSREEAEDAADVLDDCGAVDVDERAAQYEGQQVSNSRLNTDNDRLSGTSDRMDMSSDRMTTGNDRMNMTGDNDQTIERVEENLEVGKRQVEGGGVRVRSRIVEKPVEETVRLREEHVRVERNPVDRAVTDSDRTAFQEQNIELTERSEVPVVNKEARVVEEIKLSKDVNEREETVRDTVRSTEVDVDNLNEGRRNVGNTDNNNLTGDAMNNSGNTGRPSNDDGGLR